LNKKTIFLIRHGETDFNRRGVVQGSGVDSELNEQGHAQADAFYEAYQHIPFDKIYTSALQRTTQSVAKFIAKDIPHEAHASLNEISWGIREGQVPAQNDGDYYRFLTESWQNGQTDMQADGGECPEDVQKRQAPIIDLILSRPDEKLILVAMHGRAIRILLTKLLCRPLVEMDTFPHTNLGLYELEYDYTTKQFTIIRTNDTTHLD
jgi:broad specificity phosphatase PhoE